MRKCEKIIFNTLNKERRHEVCQAFLEEEIKLKKKNKNQ